jgi:hypothetical protein
VQNACQIINKLASICENMHGQLKLNCDDGDVAKPMGEGDLGVGTSRFMGLRGLDDISSEAN